LVSLSLSRLSFSLTTITSIYLVTESAEILATHQHLLRLIESAQKLVSSQGLSSIPLLPHDHPSSAEQNSSSFSTKNLSDTNNTGTPGLVSNSRSKAAEKDASSDQQGKERLTAMMELAKDSFERRARLREGAAIVNGILRPGRS